MQAKRTGYFDGAKAIRVGVITACSASGGARHLRVAGVNGLLAKWQDLVGLGAGVGHGLGGPARALAGLSGGL